MEECLPICNLFPKTELTISPEWWKAMIMWNSLAIATTTFCLFRRVYQEKAILLPGQFSHSTTPGSPSTGPLPFAEVCSTSDRNAAQVAYSAISMPFFRSRATTAHTRIRAAKTGQEGFLCGRIGPKLITAAVAVAIRGVMKNSTQAVLLCKTHTMLRLSRGDFVFEFWIIGR